MAEEFKTCENCGKKFLREVPRHAPEGEKYCPQCKSKGVVTVESNIESVGGLMRRLQEDATQARSYIEQIKSGAIKPEQAKPIVELMKELRELRKLEIQLAEMALRAAGMGLKGATLPRLPLLPLSNGGEKSA